MKRDLDWANQYRQRVERAAGWIETKIGFKPKFGVVLGTGLGALAAEIDDPVRVPYSEIPEFPISTAPGHSGELVAGRIGDTPLIAFEGRFHLYEGYDLEEVTMPVRVAARLGIETLCLTNAAGGMNLDLAKGELVVIEDHINLILPNPLFGPNIEAWGPRFPDMARPYDGEHIERVLQIAEEEKVAARPGVYVAVAGPNLETRAEYRMLRMFGADVVGMSTVPEVIVGVHEGLRIVGISVVTDICDPDDLEPCVVEDILAVAAEAEPKLTRIVKRLIRGD